MTPEILRRCSSCGASFPEGSIFCPDCGRALTRKAESTKSQADSDEHSHADEATENTASDSTQATVTPPSHSAKVQPSAQTELVDSISPANEISAKKESIETPSPTKV